MLRNPAFRQKIAEVMPTTGATVDTLNTIRAEIIKKVTTNSVARGSQTQPRQVVEKQLGGQTPIAGEVPTSQSGMIAAALQKATSGLGVAREKTIQEIGELLLSQDPATQQRALGMMAAPPLPPLLQMGRGTAGATSGGSVFLTQ